MALNFPSSPTIGQIYTDSNTGFSYEWDGTVWKSYSDILSGYVNYAEVSGISTVSQGLTGSPNLNVGVVTATEYYGTFKGTIDAGTTIDTAVNVIGGIASVTQLNVSGVSTFASDLDINASVDISNDLNVSGVITSTTLNVTSNLSVSGISTTQSLDIIGTGTKSYLRNATIENYSETIVNVGNVGAAYTYTLGYGNYFIATLDQTSTFDFDASLAPTGSVSFIIQLKNGTGGPFSITWPASVEWPAGITPTRTTTDGRTDIWTFITNDGGTNWIGNLNIVNYNI